MRGDPALVTATVRPVVRARPYCTGPTFPSMRSVFGVSLSLVSLVRTPTLVDRRLPDQGDSLVTSSRRQWRSGRARLGLQSRTKPHHLAMMATPEGPTLEGSRHSAQVGEAGLEPASPVVKTDTEAASATRPRVVMPVGQDHLGRGSRASPWRRACCRLMADQGGWSSRGRGSLRWNRADRCRRSRS